MTIGSLASVTLDGGSVVAVTGLVVVVDFGLVVVVTGFVVVVVPGPWSSWFGRRRGTSSGRGGNGSSGGRHRSRCRRDGSGGGRHWSRGGRRRGGRRGGHRDAAGRSGEIRNGLTRRPTDLHDLDGALGRAKGDGGAEPIHQDAGQSVRGVGAAQRGEVGRDVGAPRALTVQVSPEGCDRVVRTEQDQVRIVVDVEQVDVARGIEEGDGVAARRGQAVRGRREVGPALSTGRGLGEEREEIVIRPVREDPLRSRRWRRAERPTSWCGRSSSRVRPRSTAADPSRSR